MLTPSQIEQLDFAKASDGLLPCVVQDQDSAAVLMLGFMNLEAVRQTVGTRRVTFYSRSKQRLWTKGETSGHILELVDLHRDCDRDTLLAMVRPRGPTCHVGTYTCFGEHSYPPLSFVGRLDQMIAERRRLRPVGSYTTKLFASGTRRIAQKVGEEAVETALAAVAQDRAALLGEAADLLYHLTVLLHDRDASLADLATELAKRQHIAPSPVQLEEISNAPTQQSTRL